MLKLIVVNVITITDNYKSSQCGQVGLKFEGNCQKRLQVRFNGIIPYSTFPLTPNITY